MSSRVPDAPKLVVEEGDDLFTRRRDEWRALLDATPAPPFFLGGDWIETFAHHFARDEGRRLFLARLEREGVALAGLPLALAPGRLGRWRVKKLEIAGSPWLDLVDLPRRDDASGDEFVRALLEWATRELRGWTLFDWCELEENGATANAVARAVASLRLKFERRLCSRAPTWNVAADGTRPKSANLRSQLNRAAKRLAERGAVETSFELVAQPRVDAVVDECAVLEQASWKGTAAVGIFATSERRAFFLDLLRRLAASGRVAIGALRLDGKLTAYHLGFVHARRFLSYNLAHHPDLAALGPGTLLMQRMIELAPALGVDLLDASRGGLDHEHLLARYGGPVRHHEQFLIWRPGAKAAAIHFARSQLLPRLRRAFRPSSRP